MDLFNKKGVVAGLIAIVLAISCIALIASNALQTLQYKLSDNLYSEKDPHPDIVLVNVDDKTLEEFGEFARWDRDLYAQVVDNLSQYNPKVIGFDFLFFSPRDPETDQQFLESMQKSSAEIVIGMKSKKVYVLDDNVVASGLRQPIYGEGGNIHYGSYDALQDDDEVARKVPLEVVSDSLGTFPSLSAAVAQIFLGKKLEIPVENAQMLINFKVSPRDPYPSFSFVDVYNNDFGLYDPINLEGKIVLIGPYSDSFEDTFLTPLSSSFAFPGVEIHANAIQTILEGDFLRNMMLFEKIVLVLLVAFGSCYVFMFTRIRWSLAYLAGFVAIYTILAPILFGAGIIVDLIHPYLTIVAAFMAVYIYRYLTEFKSKIALKSAFSRYVNPSVAEQIAENPESLQLGGAKKDITVLFTDIAHFTTISEQLSAESLVAFLNEYLEAMSEVIMAEGGTVDKFEGDAIMAFFGAPMDQQDHASRAVRAALNMRLRLQELHEKWRKDPALPGGEKKPLIDFRCGISSGEAIVGNIGSAARLEYTAMGDIVNLGSRLEGANKQYSTNVMMSEETLKRVGKEVISRELDLIRVVGKKKPVRVYELLGLTGTVDRNAEILLTLYNDGIRLYNERKFDQALAKFEEILKSFPDDGPSKLYKQRCEVLKDFPPKDDWDGVFDMKSK